jgi:hypothetical protein
MSSALRTLRAIWIALLLVQLVPAQGIHAAPSETATAALTSEQIDVYRAFLSQYTCTEAPGCEQHSRKYLMLVTLAKMPEAPIEARCLEPWLAKGKCCLQGITLEAPTKPVITHVIPKSTVSGLKITPVSEKRARVMMNKALYQLFQLSEIAFSVDHHFAVLFYSVGSTSGSTAILERNDGSWRFDNFRSVSCTTGSTS